MSKTRVLKGETPYDAIINHNSLDIEEEQAFLDFIHSMGLSEDSSLVELESAFDEWQLSPTSVWPYGNSF